MILSVSKSCSISISVFFDEIFESGDASVISDYENTDSPNKLFNKEVRDRICELAIRLAKAESVDEFYG